MSRCENYHITSEHTLTSSAKRAAWIRLWTDLSSSCSCIDWRFSSIDLSTTPTQYDTISVRRFQFSVDLSQVEQEQDIDITYQLDSSTSNCKLHPAHCPFLFPLDPDHEIVRSCDLAAYLLCRRVFYIPLEDLCARLLFSEAVAILNYVQKATFEYR